jgi:uncharacterized protein
MLADGQPSFEPSDIKALGTFFVLAYAIAWLAWLPLVLGVHGLHITSWNVPIPFVIPGTFGPTVAALTTQRLLYSDWRAAKIWTGWRGLVLGAIAGPALIVFALTVVTCGAMVKGGPAVLQWSAFARLPISIAYSFRAGPLGEEAGWRGFALPRLQTRFGPVAASLILALFWTGWHLPLFLLDNWSSSTLVQFWLIVSMLSFFMTLGYNISDGNLWVVILMHATFNAVPRIMGPLLGSADVRSTPSMEIAIASGLGAVALMVIAVTRGKLGTKS